MVWSVISYASNIWGQKQYSCINAVQTRAQRYFLGVGRYTPNVAVHGDMGWHHPVVKQWKSVVNVWCLEYMDPVRMPKFSGSLKIREIGSVKTGGIIYSKSYGSLT